MPAISVTVPGTMRHRPPRKNTMRCNAFSGCWQKPIMARDSPHIPKIAVIMDRVTVNAVALIIRSSGASTKMYGTMKAAIASFAALTPVFMGLAPAIPEPA